LGFHYLPPGLLVIEIGFVAETREPGVACAVPLP
jgi:hypothetical protein